MYIAPGSSLFGVWVLLVFGALGTLFPNAVAGSFPVEARIIRLGAVPVLIATAVLLTDHYYAWTKGLF